jgi:aerobic-type carbon monoxide dehydrogenase small subunit (CoxS/CutS family)
VTVQFSLDGRTVEVEDDGSLLDVLRGALQVTTVKDGCSPQGQCGCCTVLVDGAPRVACVTPVRRVAGREVTTVGGLEPDIRERWGAAFCATGASQCGFCTPGIVLRLEGLRRRGRDPADRDAVDRALAAHLCRCTGWQTIREACQSVLAGAPVIGARDEAAAAQRAAIEGGAAQRVGPSVALGDGGFADDSAPADALVAVPDEAGGWAVGESLAAARRLAGKVQGRRTTLAAEPPLQVPEGDWVLSLRTSWVEPAYLETDASWCRPGGQPASPLANGGAFGGKASTEVAAAARDLADEHGRAVRVLYTREDVVRRGPKRPPVAIGIRSDGTGVLRVVRTEGIAEAVGRVAPGLVVQEVDHPGPATSVALRGAGWVEAAVLLAALRVRASGEPAEVVAPDGAWATASIVDAGDGPHLDVRVACGEVLDEVVLRSYCIGAAHMALSWVTSEALTVDEAGDIHDLTIRSFGVLPASAMPPVSVAVEAPGGRSPSGWAAPTVAVNGSDAVFAAVAAAVWCHQGCPPEWPTRQPV